MLEPHLYVLSAHLPRHTHAHAETHTHIHHTHVHTKQAHTFTLDPESCTNTDTRIHTKTAFSHWIQMPTPPPPHLPHIPSHIYTHTFSTKLTPLCTRRPANVQVLQKKSAYPSVWGKERWELLISHSAFLSLSKYKMYISVSPACIKNSDPWGLYFTKQYIHCSLQLPQQIRYVHKLQCKKTVLYGSVHV